MLVLNVVIVVGTVSIVNWRPYQVSMMKMMMMMIFLLQQEVKVIWQKAPQGGPIPRLGVTPGGRKLYHWIPGVGFPISVP